MTHGVLVELTVRCLLVVLFMPFSALDKIIDFRSAVAQAKQIASNDVVAAALIFAGLAIEIVMPLGIITGIADRLAALILGGYCIATAVLWKPFWRPG